MYSLTNNKNSILDNLIKTKRDSFFVVVMFYFFIFYYNKNSRTYTNQIDNYHDIKC